MNNLKIEIKQPNFVFCPPPPGKPDPKLPFDPNSEKARERIAQSAQKGYTCVYYALNMIRRRIGKFPCESQKQPRQLEILISERRKSETASSEKHQWKVDFAKQLAETIPSGIYNKNQAEQLIKNPGKIPLLLQEKCCEVLQSFCKQGSTDNFLTFVQDKESQDYIRTNELFFKKINVNPEEMYNKRYKGMLNKSYENLTLTDKNWALNAIAHKICYVLYGLKISPWNPDQPIERLIEQLTLYGPHVVLGYIGQEYYQEKPFELAEKVAGKAIYGWKPNTPREGSSLYHAVLLVGARSDKKVIYFIDPLDGSDPKNLESQRIYVMSYEKLKSYIANLDNSQYRDKNNNIKITEEHNYALYNPELNYL